ncbi:helix-turn-helix domain-containing protein [Ligilactobacillus hayakitensis]|nr:helix-turn-helix transcriptional regulator [Ligilactobacillus hayakitensis]
MTAKDVGLLGLRIKELRKEKGLRQSELATTLHVSQQAVGSWETGRTVPGADTLNVLADYFNVTTDYLLGRDGKEENSTDTKDLSEIMNSIMTYNGKELNQHDKDVVEGLISAYLNNKE